MKLELEQCRLQLIRERKFFFPGGSGMEDGASLSSAPGILMLHLVSKFNECDPDAFFVLFECVANSDRAQEACSAVCGEDDLDYEAVKVSMLK